MKNRIWVSGVVWFASEKLRRRRIYAYHATMDLVLVNYKKYKAAQ